MTRNRGDMAHFCQ